MTLPSEARLGARHLLIWFGGWSILATLAAGLGIFAAVDTNVFAACVVVATLALSVSALRVPSISALCAALGPYGLAAFHVWRVPAALVFFWYGAEGLLPPVFVLLAGTGDLIAGLLAALVLVLPRRRSTIVAFHIFGLADFAVAVATGITLTLLRDPQMVWIGTLPVAIIPLVGVPLSGATHIAALRLMMRRNVQPLAS